MSSDGDNRPAAGLSPGVTCEPGSTRIPKLWAALVNLAGPQCRLFLRRLAWPHPNVYHFLNSLYHPELVRPAAADLIIDGFARSGNWFAFAAFVTSQEKPVLVCRHHHAPTVILEGIRLRKPTLLLVRDPRSVIVSDLVAQPARTLREMLTGYRDYYSLLKVVRERFVIASFEQITSDFGKVVAQMNQRYGTSYREFIHTPENIRSCFAWLERAQRMVDPSLPEGLIAHPNKACDVLKKRAAEELDRAIQTNRRIARLMRECEELYSVFAETARPKRWIDG